MSILSKNRVLTAHAWSVSEEIIRYLKTWKLITKKCVLQEYLSTMTTAVTEKKTYSQELIVRTFHYL